MYFADCCPFYHAPLSLDGQLSSRDVRGRLGYLAAGWPSLTEAENAEARLLDEMCYHGLRASRDWHYGVDLFADALPDDEDPTEFTTFEVRGRVFYAAKERR